MECHHAYYASNLIYKVKTLSDVGIYLLAPILLHDQLYVTLSCAQSFANVKLLKAASKIRRKLISHEKYRVLLQKANQIKVVSISFTVAFLYIGCKFYSEMLKHTLFGTSVLRMTAPYRCHLALFCFSLLSFDLDLVVQKLFIIHRISAPINDI